MVKNPLDAFVQIALCTTAIIALAAAFFAILSALFLPAVVTACCGLVLLWAAKE